MRWSSRRVFDPVRRLRSTSGERSTAGASLIRYRSTVGRDPAGSSHPTIGSPASRSWPPPRRDARGPPSRGRSIRHVERYTYSSTVANPPRDRQSMPVAGRCRLMIDASWRSTTGPAHFRKTPSTRMDGTRHQRSRVASRSSKPPCKGLATTCVLVQTAPGDCKQPESPRSLDSCDSLRSSLHCGVFMRIC